MRIRAYAQQSDASSFGTSPKSAQAVTHEVQPAEPAVNDKPKRRWFQFSLRTAFFAFPAIAFGASAWWQHRSDCLARMEYHEEQARALRFSAFVGETDRKYGGTAASLKAIEGYRTEAIFHERVVSRLRWSIVVPVFYVDESSPTRNAP